MCLQHEEHNPVGRVGQGTSFSPHPDRPALWGDPVTQFYESLGQPVTLEAAAEPLQLKAAWSQEEVFVIVYTVVDDSYQKLFGGPAWFRRSPNRTPVFSDSEVITLALVAELAGYDSCHSWWAYVAKNYRYLFPRLCDRTRYERRLHQLRPAIEQFRQHLLFLLNADLSDLRVVDSFPVSVCHLRRLASSSQPFDYSATVGYCAAKKEFFYGFRVHVVTDPCGLVVGYVLTPGHVHDTKGLVFLLQDLSRLEALIHYLAMVLGDKGYVGEDYARQLKAEFGVELLAMRREYEKELPPSAHNQMVGKARKIIETTISVLTGTMNAAWTYARSLAGFLTNLVVKMTAFTLGNYLNRLMGEPVLQVTSIVC